MVKRLLLLLIISLSIVFGASLTLDEQIAQLKNADSKDRYEMMNAIKQRISTMNATERTQAINQLRSKMQNHTNTATPMPSGQQKQMLGSDQIQQMNQHNQMQSQTMKPNTQNTQNTPMTNGGNSGNGNKPPSHSQK
jgi:ERCC4-related helicase